MEKVSLEKLRQSWNEIGVLLQKMEQSGLFTTLDSDLLRQKLTSIYEELLSMSPGISEGPVLKDFHSRAQMASRDEIQEDIPSHTPEPSLGKSSRKEASKTEASHESIPDQSQIKTATEKSAIVAGDNTAKGKNLSREEEHGPQVIGEKFQEHRKLVHDELAAKVHSGKKDLSSSLQSQPIENIEKAIGINDKFLYIKELFNNNGVQYKEVVEYLNHCKNMDDAMQYISSHFDWSPEDPVAEKFLALVKRRHG